MKRLLFLLLVFMVGVTQAQTTWVVDSLNDSGFGSLRAAADSCSSGDTIRFNRNLIANGSDSIVLTSGEISIDSINVVIKGLFSSTDTLFISGNDSSRILSFIGGSRIVLDSLVLVNGNATLGTGQGGAVCRLDCSDTLFVLNSVISGNTSLGNGGAVSSSFYSSPSAVVISNSIVSGNTSSGKGGGVYASSTISTSFVHVLNSTISGNTASGKGGGVYSDLGSSLVFIEKSTLSGNTASGGGGVLSEADHVWPSTISGVISNIIVRNSTIVGNAATFSGAGGILSISFDTSAIEITNSTIYGNSTVSGEAGIGSSSISSSVISVTSSIIAENGPGSSGINNNSWSALTTISSGGYNIFSDTLSGTIAMDSINVSSLQLNLEPLAFNGGTTQTMMPGLGSYALDNGNPNDSSDAQNSPIVGTRNVGAAEDCFSLPNTVYISQCASYTGPSGNNTYTQSGVYFDTLVNMCGGDSLIQIILTLTKTFETVNVSTCDSFISPSGNYVWTSSGTYMDTIPNYLNCDSIITINLTVNSPTYATASVAVCDNYVSPSGRYLWSSSGTYMDTITNASNCDSILTINLTVTNSTSSSITVISCDSYTSPSGNYVWTSSNIYVDTIPNAVNCDSVITINLTINHSNLLTDVVSVCDSYTWINGVTYTSSNNTASVQYTNALGCDSIIMLDLTILQPTLGVDVVSACDSLTWIDGITYYSNNNTAQDTLVNANGCDSIVSLDLTILQPTSATDVVIACDSLMWIDGVTYYSNTQTVKDTLLNSVGCDSVVTLDLTIIQSSTSTDVITACDSLTWINGVTYYSSNNVATETLINGAGCDSVVYLDLTIINSTSFTDVITACDSLIWVDGITYYSSNNNAKDTLVNSVGCDSIVSLNLTISQSNVYTDIVVSCDSMTWINGATYYQDTLVTHTIANSFGCDSVVTLDLTIHQSTMAVDSVIAVNQYTWIDGVTYYAHNSTATHTLTNTVGCDSVVSLYLEIQVVEIGLDQVGSTLIATADSGTFQWVECPNYDIISGATDSIFTPTQNGSYAVIVTQNGYTDTSDCITVNNVGIGEVNLSNNINIYPNPVHDQVNIEITNWPTNGAVIVVRDITGKQVYTEEIEPISNKETVEINTTKWAKGTYFIEVGEGENRVIEQIVVQ